MKKKIAIFTTGWCCEILSQFITGMTAALKDSAVDLFLFLCYPTYVDKADVRHGELNIFSLPDLKDFDGAVIFGSGLNFQSELDKLTERCLSANIPLIMQGARNEHAYYVGSDNYSATLKMCDHLIREHNVNSIVFLAGTLASYDSELRLKAVEDYLASINKSELLKEVHYTKWENIEAANYINKYWIIFIFTTIKLNPSIRNTIFTF